MLAMSHKIQTSPDGTITLTMTIPWSEIASMYESVVGDIVKDAEISGFRKGKAPRAMVEPTIDKNKAYEEVIKRLVPKVYSESLTENHLSPIISPQIELQEAKENSDWIIQAKTAEKPTVTLGDYKKAIKEKKPSNIIIPGKETEEKKPTLDEILLAVLPTITITIPEVLIDHEVTNQLSQLVDQTKKIGVTIEQYLASTQRTADSIRQEYKSQAVKSLSLEFGIEAIADAEKIEISDADIENVIKTAKTGEEKASLESQRYYLASILRRQKTLDFLSAL